MDLGLKETRHLCASSRGSDAVAWLAEAGCDLVINGRDRPRSTGRRPGSASFGVA